VIEPLEGMPNGTIGFRATGRPGEVKLYELDGLEDAKTWVAT
jgi:hypothetical protein